VALGERVYTRYLVTAASTTAAIGTAGRTGGRTSTVVAAARVAAAAVVRRRVVGGGVVGIAGRVVTARCGLVRVGRAVRENEGDKPGVRVRVRSLA